MTHKILQPAGWARPKGYANGIAARGTQVFIAGQIGWDAEQIRAATLAGQVGIALATSCACSKRRAGGRNTWCASPGT